jgi:nucleoside-diphosphate kinase
MEKQVTLAIIKPDAVAAKNTGKIIDLIEHNGFEILGLGKIHLIKEQAEAFYAVHAQRGFFPELVEFMTSGPIVVLALEKENAVADWRKLMGETDPAKAAAGTVRKLFGKSIGENATHGSDSVENAVDEIEFFFPYMDEDEDFDLDDEDTEAELD